MPIRNIWSLRPGEVLVAEEIMKRIPDVAVYFPVRDVGIDLLAEKGGRYITIQVKESRYYVWGEGYYENAWHQVSEKRVDTADLFVFLTHVLKSEGRERPRLEPLYLIVPKETLRRRVDAKKLSGGRYHFQFSFGTSEVLDVRGDCQGDLTEYQEFLGNWERISKALH